MNATLTTTLFCLGFTALSPGATHDLFVTDSRGGTNDAILSYDLDNGISSTLNAADGDLNTYYDSGGDDPFFKGMDANESGVFWSNSDNNILFQGMNDLSPTTLYSSQTNDLEIVAVHGTSLYWHSEDTDTIYKGGTDGVTARTVVATGVSTVTDMVATDDYIYYTNNTDDVRRVSTSGGSPEVLFSVPFAFARLRGIDVYNDAIYVAEYDVNTLYMANLDGSGVAEVPGLTVLHTTDLDIANDILFLLSDGGSVSAKDRITVFDLNNMSNNGLLVENLELSSGMAVLPTIPEPRHYVLFIGLVTGLACYRLRRKVNK